LKIATLANAAVVHTRRWVDHFRARGHEVRVWSLERGPDSLRAEALPCAPLPGALRYPLAAPALAKALRGFGPDLVDAHYVPNYGLMGVLAGVKPLVVSAWGSDLLIDAARDPLRRARARYVLTRADRVIADSANLAAAARALVGSADRVLEIPWGVDPDLFRPAASREPGLLLSTRMHESVYDLPTLISGVASVLRTHPAARLAIAGDGSLTRELEALAARVLPQGRFEFIGRLNPERMAAWMGRAEIYLSASRSDSTSVSLLEAMSSGAVPVVSDLDGNREWVADGEGARTFVPGDATSLARSLMAALEDPAWRERARARNLEVIAQRGRWPDNMRRIENVFESLISGSGRKE
jgi:glycosyltransferase involved in cell wall biosynthesis